MSALAQTYAFKAVASNAHGEVMSPDGDLIAGISPINGNDVPTIWKGEKAYVIGDDTDSFFFTRINQNGWVMANTTDLYPLLTNPAIWRWDDVTENFIRFDIGNINGLQDTVGVGIDDSNRIFGYATNRVRPADKIWLPFVWTEATGFTDITSYGHPGYPELPLAVSPGGVIATENLNYLFGDPTSEVMISQPAGPYLANAYTTKFVNDSGVRAGFVYEVELGNAWHYLARYSPVEDSWQLLSSASPDSVLWGTGSLTAGGDITATLWDPSTDQAQMGVRANGPEGIAVTLNDQVTAAYGGLMHVEFPKGEADDGRILANVDLGDSALMGYLLPVSACSANCLVARLGLTVRVVDRTGSCSNLQNKVRATVRVMDENRRPVAGAMVTIKVYDRNELTQSAVTNSRGVASFQSGGPGCNGYVNAIVQAVELPGATFDQTSGTLAVSVLP